MHAFILAGGFATRLWPLTEKRAKPLLPLTGKPILSHLVEKIPSEIPIVVSTNAALEEGFTHWKYSIGRSNLEIVVEETAHDDEKLGALGAVAQWVETHNVNDDLLLLAGDNYCGFAMENFLAQYEDGTPLIAAYDIGDLEKARSFGTVITGSDSKTVIDFEEKPREPKTTLVSTGFSIIPKHYIALLKTFAKEKPDNIGGIFEEFLRKNITIHCFVFQDPWFDIGSFDAYLNATIALVGQAVVRDSTATLESTECEGSIVIGAHSHVKNSRLSNVVIFEGSTVVDCELSDCILDNGCLLQGIDLQGKMLRENTNLQKE